MALSALFLGCESRKNEKSSEAKTMSMSKPLLSLAQWSLHKALFNGDLKAIDFPNKSVSLGIKAVEYVNQFYIEHVNNSEYWKDLKRRTDDLGVKNLLIMVDDEGLLGDPDQVKRKKAVENHYKWVDAANMIGCHSIRVNAFGTGSNDEMMSSLQDGLGLLAEYAANQNKYLKSDNE